MNCFTFGITFKKSSQIPLIGIRLTLLICFFSVIQESGANPQGSNPVQSQTTSSISKSEPESATSGSQADVYYFDIATQPLVDALAEFSAQSGIQFFCSDKKIAVHRSPPVKGTFTAEAALKAILRFTLYRFEFTNPNTVVLYRVSAQTAAKPSPKPEQSADSLGSLASSDSTFFSKDGYKLEEVVVTARMREENLLDSPLAITVVTMEDSLERDMEDLSNISKVAPNIDFSFGGTSSGSSSAAVIYIRGVGQNDFTPVTDPGVGVYIDGVYLGRTLGAATEIADLKQVEILRGPQGTLFGRNTIGGAITLTTEDPKDEFSVNLRLTGGEFNRRESYGKLDIPLSSKMGFSFSALRQQRDGYVERPLDGVHLGDENVTNLRSKLLWQPRSDLEMRLSVDALREREESAAEALTFIAYDSVFVSAHNNNTFGTGAQTNCNQQPLPPNHDCVTDEYLGAPYTNFDNGPSRNNIDQWGISNILDWHISNGLTLKSISAYRDIRARFSRSSDGTPFTLLQSTDDYTQNQFSQEIRLNGEALENRFNWVAGIFYMREEADNVTLVEGSLPDYPRLLGGQTKNSNRAVFWENSYSLSARWQLTTGIRYTRETKAFTPNSVSLVTGEVFIPAQEGKLHFAETTWRASLLHKISRRISSYLTLSRGFKSGGFVQRILHSTPTHITYDPEKVTQYELGLKGVNRNNKLRYSLSAFWSEYSDIQVAANPPGLIGTITDNAAEGSVLGSEIEMTWIPVPRAKLQAALGFQRARYDEIGNIDVAVGKDDDFIRTPKWSWNMAFSYLIPLPKFGALTPRLDWTYRSEIQFEPDNDPFVAEDGYHTFNASFLYTPPDPNWRIQLGVNNLTDEQYMIAGDSNHNIGYALAVYSRPRNWYLSLDWTL